MNKEMTMKKALFVTALLLAAGSAALAERSVSQTVPAAPDGEVSVELISGRVEIIGWDRDEVEVTGSIGDDVEELLVEAEDGDVSIEIELPEGRRNLHDADARLTVRVPRRADVDVETVSAEISIEETAGEVEAESVSGGIEVRGSVERAEVSSVSGKIEVTSGEALSHGEFETVSGDIELRSALRPGASLSFESVSGNITLHLPGETSAEFEMETFSGSIENDFGPEAKRSSDYAPGKSLRFSSGSGGTRVEIESFSGGIRLRRD